MQFSTIVATLTFALAAVAAPTGGNGGKTADQCNANGDHQVCCSGFGCLIQVLGANCNQQAYCCESGDSTVSDSKFLQNIKTTSLTENPGWTHQHQPPQLRQALVDVFRLTTTYLRGM